AHVKALRAVGQAAVIVGHLRRVEREEAVSEALRQRLVELATAAVGLAKQREQRRQAPAPALGVGAGPGRLGVALRPQVAVAAEDARVAALAAPQREQEQYDPRFRHSRTLALPSAGKQAAGAERPAANSPQSSPFRSSSWMRRSASALLG